MGAASLLHGVGGACKPHFGQQATCEGGDWPGLPVCSKHDFCVSGWGDRPMAGAKVSNDHFKPLRYYPLLCVCLLCV